MTWRVDISDGLRADLEASGPDLFARACDAVHRFAESGEGIAYPVGVDASVWRFFVPGGHIYVQVDDDALTILRVVPDEPLPPVEPLLDEGGPPSSDR